MKFSLFLSICLFVVFADRTLGSPYIDDEEDSLQVADFDYMDNALINLMRAPQQKRTCIRRGGNCDHRPKDCCYSSSCRCNLWGTNCQCQRMGLFQKWG
ncbi:U8-agatoxin-Ao1a-like isoform X2 [Bombus affinis]|uniref:U8-agatoxin-Ao1a isoform X2 n=1 Tax=Bombus terrestris TaxID=30195 RepID=A0A9B0BVM9_BOMTE|nr:U8-agatoxin-Ao1a isoform X2 [Bombus terrestris]XP_050583208.1 U8-agatoxin-Ao1a-like isoform X2 [Bombus affinis]